MKIAVVGTGYVGLVTGICFAETGNKVTCVDIDQSKVDKLSGGQITIYEPGLEKIFLRNIKESRLKFTTQLEDAVEDFHEPVYFEETFDVQIKSADGTLRNMKTKVHNPVQSAKRKCDGLIPLFEQRKVLFKASFGNAETLVVDAERMLQVMIEEYKINGVTMYNPKGKN